jgi:hypothetical protein
MADIFTNDAEIVAKNIRNPKALADIGLKFILEDKIRKELLNLDESIVNNLFKVLADALTATTEKINEEINLIPELDSSDEEAKF